MSEEKFYCGAIDFWEKNKELDSLQLLNKFMEEKYFPLDEKIKEVREFIEKYSIMYEHEIEPYKVVESEELLEILARRTNNEDNRFIK